MSLTVPLFRMYSEQARDIQRDEYLMRLAIATNPHIDGKKQGALWDRLKRRRKGRPRKEMSEERKREARAAVEAVRGKLNGV